MPETTESVRFDRPAGEVFARIADLGRLAEWDPTFTSSRRLDDGPLGVGSRFEAVGEAAGRGFTLVLEIVTYEAPTHVVLRGTGSGLSTTESIRVEETPDGGSEVTWTSRLETEASDLVDALGKPAFVLVAKRAIGGLKGWLDRSG